MKVKHDLLNLFHKHGIEPWMVAEFMFMSDYRFNKLISSDLDEETLQGILTALYYAELTYGKKK